MRVTRRDLPRGGLAAGSSPVRVLQRQRCVLARLALLVVFLLQAGVSSAFADAGSAVVGRQGDGGVLLPDGQTITPTGTQLEIGGRPQVLAVNPRGGTVAVANGSTIVALEVATGRVIDSVPQPGGSISVDGLAYDASGSRLLSSAAGGAVGITPVAADGSLLAAGQRSITLPADSPAPPFYVGGNPYPGGLAVSPDGLTAYVALSRSNALGVLTLATGALVKVPVGNAPHSVALSADGRSVWVSNEGGRPATPADTSTNRSAGSEIVSDPFGGGSVTGTVSRVDVTTGAVTATVPVGLHPTNLLLDGGRLFVANSNSDTVSVIDTATATVAQTLAITPFPQAPFGSFPTALAMLPGDRLAVTLGRDNALAVFALHGPTAPATYEGLVPTAWYPAAVVRDPGSGRVVVANEKGVGALANPGAAAHQVNSDALGSVSILTTPSPEAVAAATPQVLANDGFSSRDTVCPSAAATPTAIPLHIGEPSLIKHVVYIVKENRAYDQILGDVGRGASDPSLTMFGAAVTPNQHAFATTYGPLLDNFYDSGSVSNDGHNWAMQAQSPDYLERQQAGGAQRTDLLEGGTPPSSGFDALLYTPAGFLWENALRHGKTFDDYGEYTVEEEPAPSRSDIPSLDAHVMRDYSGFFLGTPDQTRADIFARHLQAYTAAGSMPDLVMMTLPNDHTGGSNPQYPTPTSQVADNDAGLGKIVDSLSHSPFWRDTAVFVEEDDAQGGVDHVDGHRSTGFVLSPYARKGVLDHTFYSQVSLIRTIEQILGLPPMTQLDLAASPMRALFTDTPDLTPYTAVIGAAARQPVMNPPLAATSGVQRAWVAQSRTQDTGRLDAVDPALLNRDIWYATKGYATPYPGDGKVLWPQEVRRTPGHATSAPRAAGGAGDGEAAPRTSAGVGIGVGGPVAVPPAAPPAACTLPAVLSEGRSAALLLGALAMLAAVGVARQLRHQ